VHNPTTFVKSAQWHPPSSKGNLIQHLGRRHGGSDGSGGGSDGGDGGGAMVAVAVVVVHVVIFLRDYLSGTG